jgi:hypothetical protein
MSFSVVVIIVGAAFLAIGLIGGGIKFGVKEGEASIPALNPITRILAFIIGIGLITYGIWQEAHPSMQVPSTSTPTSVFVTATEISVSASSTELLEKHFSTFGYEYTWTNTDGTTGSAKITDVRVDGNSITMKYDYKSGVLEGVLTGNILSGTWTQENSTGNFELTFTPDFSTATGWWDDVRDAEPRPKNQFGIR